MQVFQPSSVFSVVVGQPVENTVQRLVMFSSCAIIGSVFCHSWGHHVATKSTGRVRKFKTLGCCHRVTLERPIQEGSRSLATDKTTSNHIISTVALIGLIVSTSYFQNLSQQASSHHYESSRKIYWQMLFNPCHMKRNSR